VRVRSIWCEFSISSFLHHCLVHNSLLPKGKEFDYFSAGNWKKRTVPDLFIAKKPFINRVSWLTPSTRCSKKPGFCVRCKVSVSTSEGFHPLKKQPFINRVSWLTPSTRCSKKPGFCVRCKVSVSTSEGFPPLNRNSNFLARIPLNIPAQFSINWCNSCNKLAIFLYIDFSGIHKLLKSTIL